MRKIILSFITLVFLASCGGGTQYLDPNQASGSIEWGPKEIKLTVNKMVKSMYGFLKNDYKKPSYIEVKRVRNKSSEHIDVSLITEEIATNLIKNRVRFIDRSLTADMMKEMELGVSGLVDPDSAIPIGALKSPNFYLTGSINDNVRRVGGRNVQYIVVTLKLVQVKSLTTFWQERKEFLKSTKTDRVEF